MLNIIKALLAIVLLTFAVGHLSSPSDLHVAIGAGEVIVAVAAIYSIIKTIKLN